MAKYIKANPLVAKYLHLEGDRNTAKDGNYLLWQGDMVAFGRPAELYDIAVRIGALVLTPYEARQEQDGTVLRPLPVATDDRFVTDAQREAQKETDSPESDSPESNPSETGSLEVGSSEVGSSLDAKDTNKTADAEKGE